jgi:hypothetical protein
MQPFGALDDPMAIAREKISGERHFNEKSRKAMCDNSTTFLEYFKTAQESVLGSMKYTNEKDLVAFKNNKTECFRNCAETETPQDKELCIPFTPDPNAEVCTFHKNVVKPPGFLDLLRNNFEQYQKDLKKGTYDCRTTRGSTRYSVDSRDMPRKDWVQIP